jgi:hypothetical protein
MEDFIENPFLVIIPGAKTWFGCKQILWKKARRISSHRRTFAPPTQPIAVAPNFRIEFSKVPGRWFYGVTAR